MTGRKWIYIASLLIVAAILAYYLLFYGAYRTNSSIASNYSFVVGIGTHGNLSSEIKSLQSGIKYYRTDISLSQSQESQLTTEHDKYGAHYLGILDYNTLPGGFSNKGWNLSAWNSSVAAALKAYPWINSWEIWNEPWVPAFQTGYVNGSAYNYYQVLKSAYTIIKRINPNATVVCFGGAPIYSPMLYNWYSRVWGYGASKYCDAISIHAYPDSIGTLNKTGVSEWSAVLSEYEALTHLPMWITEFGIPSSSNATVDYSQSNQEAFMVQAFNLFNKYGFVKRVYWYDLWGLSDGPVGNDFGLLNLSDPSYGTPSIAWHAFSSIYNRSLSK